MGIFSTILGAVAGPLIGGLMGRGESRTTTSSVNYKKLVKNAQAAGFNPLTALRNGGAAGFQTTHHPALSMGAAVGNAISQGFSAYQAQPSDMQLKREQLELQVMQAQLDSWNRNGVPAGSQPISIGATQSSKTPAVKAVPLGGVLPPTAGEVTVTNPWQDVKNVNAGHNDVAAYEERYGDSEVAQTLFFGKTAMADVFQWGRDHIANTKQVRPNETIDEFIDRVAK